jgi:hypothetical protein
VERPGFGLKREEGRALVTPRGYIHRQYVAVLEIGSDQDIEEVLSNRYTIPGLGTDRDIQA